MLRRLLRRRKIVSVNTTDRGSGAEKVAWTLFKGFQRRRWESWLVVGDKKTRDPFVLSFFASPFIAYRPYETAAWQQTVADAKRWDATLGIEDFNFPYSQHLPDLTGSPPDVFLLHNLHGGYFDLRALPALSTRTPTVLVLHDCWTMTGHCAYPVACERWRSGCGRCPDLTLTPAISSDATAFNWRRKRDIYQRSRLFVTAPTRWLLESAQNSILAPALRASRVIPCPVDLQRFHPAPRAEVRHALGLPLDAHVLVFAAHRAKTNPYKDHATIVEAIRRVAQMLPDEKILFLGLGEAAPEERIGNLQLRYLPFQTELNVSRYLQAADLYVHAARAENAGLVTAEAQACGTPVVSTAVGGLPETVADGERGTLVPPGDPPSMAEAIGGLLRNPERRHRLGAEAARYAREHWAVDVVVSQYLTWFEEMSAQRRTQAA